MAKTAAGLLRPTGTTGHQDNLDIVLKAVAAGTFTTGTTPTLATVNTLLTNLKTYADAAMTIADDPRLNLPTA